MDRITALGSFRLFSLQKKVIFNNNRFFLGFLVVHHSGRRNGVEKSGIFPVPRRYVPRSVPLTVDQCSVNARLDQQQLFLFLKIYFYLKFFSIYGIYTYRLPAIGAKGCKGEGCLASLGLLVKRGAVGE